MSRLPFLPEDERQNQIGNGLTRWLEGAGPFRARPSDHEGQGRIPMKVTPPVLRRLARWGYRLFAVLILLGLALAPLGTGVAPAGAQALEAIVQAQDMASAAAAVAASAAR